LLLLIGMFNDTSNVDPNINNTSNFPIMY